MRLEKIINGTLVNGGILIFIRRRKYVTFKIQITATCLNCRTKNSAVIHFFTGY